MGPAAPDILSSRGISHILWVAAPDILSSRGISHILWVASAGRSQAG
ncbi:MAG: hypothetical protein HYR49_06620 [Gammaproteobacteria bacterium]|nr:hypothetical protein [Gammaproteobacteria bacterium]